MNKLMNESEQTVNNMMVGETLPMLCFLAQGLGVDVGKPSDRKEVFGMCGKDNLKAQGAEKWDLIALTFLGKKLSPVGRPYNAYSLIVDKGQ